MVLSLLLSCVVGRVCVDVQSPGDPILLSTLLRHPKNGLIVAHRTDSVVCLCSKKLP